ncbi:hypothetical protein [Idiomarina ramblicola]|uniref:Uncharacterized protein n=1 Tax=Idiomarina ramblicola TaxID=263724 RepID=A0A432Z5J8_9GAMM|nr:hypothetical protein [Idiomarina ramblicola]RUO73166.1 hypothetical protein CWI78_01620 [Idiomarina ramblicola]
MNIAKRIVILAGAVGLFFYTAEQEDLITLIANFNLGWYKLGVPIAWGLVLGGLCALLRLRWLLSWMAPVTLVASAITTMGLIGAIAVFAKHQLVVLSLPPLQLASVGIGLYLFGVSLTKLMGDIEARKSEKGEE